MSRREALGLPSPSFAESLPAACEVLERQPSGVFSQNLDEPLRPGEELNFEYPEAERRARAEGVVLLLVRVTADGSVSGAYTSQPTPGHPAFAESVIRTACRLRFNKPRRADAPVTALFPQYAEFKLD